VKLSAQIQGSCHGKGTAPWAGGSCVGDKGDTHRERVRAYRWGFLQGALLSVLVERQEQSRQALARYSFRLPCIFQIYHWNIRRKEAEFYASRQQPADTDSH
jgi:hypothetical protein